MLNIEYFLQEKNIPGLFGQNMYYNKMKIEMRILRCTEKSILSIGTHTTSIISTISQWNEESHNYKHYHVLLADSGFNRFPWVYVINLHSVNSGLIGREWCQSVFVGLRYKLHFVIKGILENWSTSPTSGVV